MAVNPITLIKKAIRVRNKYGLYTALKRSKIWLRGNIRHQADRLPIYRDISFILSKRRLSNLSTSSISSPKDAVDAASSYRGVGLYRSIEPQISSEKLVKLAQFIDSIDPERIVEIGTAEGGSLWTWCHGINYIKQIIGIDINFWHRRLEFYKLFSPKNVDLTLMKESSQQQSTVNRAVDELNGSSADFIFIDGDHTYDGVKRDFELWSGIVRTGGYIAFHDIHANHGNVGVGKLWNELQPRYESIQFDHGKEAMWGGIGIIKIED